MKNKLLVLTVSLLILVAVALPGPVLNASPGLFQSPPPEPPANDNWADATPIYVWFSEGLDTSQASLEDGEPAPGCAQGYSWGKSVWYAYTPTESGSVRVRTEAGFTPAIGLYTGSSLDMLSQLDYRCWGNSLRFVAEAGTTYYIQVGAMYGSGGWLGFYLEPPSPPYADFYWWPATPSRFDFVQFYNNSWDPEGVGIASCAWDFGDGDTSTDCYPYHQYEADGNYDVVLTVTTYDGRTASTTRTVSVYTPPPVADFYSYPWDPSVFDTISFSNNSWDPANNGIASCAWDFGDGSTSTDWYPSHRYAADGDYTVQLTVTTYDGRTASITRTVPVRTHDVAITKFTAPSAASVGQTRSIVVGLNSKRSPERVEVTLWKSVPGGEQWFGSLVQSVPVRPANRTTDFKFSYTFTAEDAAMGKVTFRAVANIQGARDALPADNEAIAMPTKVSR